MKLIVHTRFTIELEIVWKPFEREAQLSIFQSYGWLKFWQETVGERSLNVKPWIAIIFDDDERPKMIFPLGVRKRCGVRVLEFLGSGQSDYLGPLIHKNWMDDPSRVKVACDIVTSAFPRHDVRHFSKLPSLWGKWDNPIVRIWNSMPHDRAYSAILPMSFDEFKSKLRSKLRSDNNRQRRRLSEKGVLSFEVFEEKNDGCLTAINTMIGQKRQRYWSTGIPDIFSDESVRQFYRELPMLLSDEGRTHIAVLKLNDMILATHWGVVYRHRFYFLMPTFRDDEWGVYSPGRLLLEHLIEWAIENHLRVFDFTIGGEEYKKDWCNTDMPLFEHLQAVTTVGLPYAIYIRMRRRARKNDKVWNIIKYIYSQMKYGKRKNWGI